MFGTASTSPATSGSSQDCWTKCSAATDCGYWSWDSIALACHLFPDKTVSTEDYDGVYSGEARCRGANISIPIIPHS